MGALPHIRALQRNLARQRIIYADQAMVGVKRAIQSQFRRVLYQAVDAAHKDTRPHFSAAQSADNVAALRTAMLAPLLRLAQHTYSLAGRETAVVKAGVGNRESGVGGKSRAPIIPDKDHAADFVLKNNWPNLGKWVATTAEGANATLSARVLKIWEDAKNAPTKQADEMSAAERQHRGNIKECNALIAESHKTPDQQARQTELTALIRAYVPAPDAPVTPAQIAQQLLGLGGDMTEVRADMLARTGSIWASNEGSVQRFKDDGVPAMEWMTVEDDMTCPFCAHMDGKVISVDDGFFAKGATLTVGQSSMRFGHGDCDHPPLHPNCRCTLIPVVDERQIDTRLSTPAPQAAGSVVPTPAPVPLLLPAAVPAPVQPITPLPPAQLPPHKEMLDALQAELQIAQTLEADVKQKALALAHANPNGNIQQLIADSRNAAAALDAHNEKMIAKVHAHLAVPNPSTVSAKSSATIQRDPNRKRLAREGVDLFQTLVGDNVMNNKQVQMAAKPGTTCSYNNNTVNMVRSPRETSVIHELGHWLEDDPVVKQKAEAFLARRTQGEVPESLATLTGINYPPSVMTKKDKFIDVYMGREYVDNATGIRYGTEIMSMGLEYLKKDPIGLAQKDPDYFDFIINTCRGK